MSYKERDMDFDTPFWFFDWTDCFCDNECEDGCQLSTYESETRANDFFDFHWAEAESETRRVLNGTGVENASVFYGVQWTARRSTNAWGGDATDVFYDKPLSDLLVDLRCGADANECLGLYFDGVTLAACGDWTECAVLLSKEQYDVLMHWALASDEPELKRWCVEGSPLLDAVLALTDVEARVVASMLSDLNDGDADFEELDDTQRFELLTHATNAMHAVSELGGVFGEAVLLVLAS